MMSDEVLDTYSENSPPRRKLRRSSRSFFSPLLTPVKVQRDILGRSRMVILNQAESRAADTLSMLTDTSSK